MSNSLNIFNFSNYRTFIKTWLNQARQEKTFNHARLAGVAQVHPTFLSQVLNGTKDLSLEQAAFISAQFSLTKLEQEYFFVLLQLDRAGTQLLKDHWLMRKREIELEKNKLSRRLDKHRLLNAEQISTFFSSWLYSAVWTFTGVRNGQSSIQIAKYFQINRNKVNEILIFLTQAGICKRKEDHYSPGEVHIHVSNESPDVVKHHSNWRLQAIQRMDVRQEEELFFTAPVTISKKDFPRLRERLNHAIKEFVDVAKESEAEELVCLNIDFFRLRD